MHWEEFDKFTKKGYFTIRRTDKFYSGIFSDQTIEQMLMRQIKIKGGLINRGLSEHNMGKWIGCLIALVDISSALCEFVGLDFGSSEQHKDARKSKTSDDVKVMNVIFDFLQKNYPFPSTPEIFSIVSGLKGNTIVNCYNALETGLKNLSDIVNRKFTYFKLKKPTQL